MKESKVVSTAALLAGLFLTAAAAEVRGFRLRTRQSGYKKYPFTAVDLAAFAFCALLLAGAVLL